MDSQRRLGILLVAVGGLALAVQFVGGLAWPWFVLVPGLALLVLAWSGFDANLAIPGSTVTTVGVILLLQNATDTFYTWSYAWGLVLAASGAGRALRGSLQGQDAERRAGRATMYGGLTLFAAFGVFFEFVVFRDDLGQIAAWALPVLLIAAGLYLAWRQNRRESPGSET